MTTVADAEMREPQEQSSQRLWLALAGSLLATLLLTPFLPDSLGADTAARVFVLLLLLIAAIDFLTLKVPNALVYPSVVFALAVTAIIDPVLLPTSVAGGAAALVIMFLLAVVQRGAMGMGDVKVACLIGCMFGLKGGVFSLLFGFPAAGVIALPLVVLGLKDRKDRLPLAPFLVVGAFLSYYFWGFVIPGEL